MTAEFAVRGPQSLDEIEILESMLSEDFASGPNVSSEAVVKEQRKSLFFVQRSV